MTPANLDALADALARVKFLETEWSEATDRHEAAVREQHHLEEKLDTQRRARCAAEARAAQLQAEVEAKDRAILLLLPFVDYAAGEGLMFVETEDGEHPEMDAADIVIAAAKEIGLELSSDASEAFLAEGYAAIRAARAATAREGQADG